MTRGDPAGIRYPWEYARQVEDGRPFRQFAPKTTDFRAVRE
jgi:hypothetical protein